MNQAEAKREVLKLVLDRLKSIKPKDLKKMYQTPDDKPRFDKAISELTEEFERRSMKLDVGFSCITCRDSREDCPDCGGGGFDGAFW
jgi:hypothetical protein